MIRDRIWAGMHELAAMAGAGAAHRAADRRGVVTVSDMGVPHPWAVNAVVGPAVPPAADLAEAIDWLRAHDHGAGWRVSVSPQIQDRVATPTGLTPIDSLPLYAMPAARADALDPIAVADLDISPASSLDDVVSAYGGWMSDDRLARLLVSPADLANESRAFLVARLDRLPIGCAFVWWVAGTGYLSGIGLLPQHRGRGFGRALTTAAAILAAAGPRGGTAPDVIWMGATQAGASLYARMGFEQVDTEVRLGPATAARPRAREG